MFIRYLNTVRIPLAHYNFCHNYFTQLIKSKKNILIAGSTGCGKTTFVNALLGEINQDEHLVMIEDTQELLPPHSNTTRMLVDHRNKNKSMKAYMNYAMRMSPGRIILGELRSQEVESALLAINTGHNGFISTIHANSAKDALIRMALLFKMYSSKDLSFELTLKLITSNIDHVIYLENKEIKEVIEVYGSEGSNIFFDHIQNEKAILSS